MLVDVDGVGKQGGTGMVEQELVGPGLEDAVHVLVEGESSDDVFFSSRRRHTRFDCDWSSDVCSSDLVSVQAYNWRRKLARRVVVIAVGDAGVGFRHSLEPTQNKRFGDRWGDAAALEAALVQGVSRFRDPGRGQGLAGIRRYLVRWTGKIAIRSGTARIAIVPPWDDDVPLKDGLPPFPGAQVLIIIPEQGSAER